MIVGLFEKRLGREKQSCRYRLLEIRVSEEKKMRGLKHYAWYEALETMKEQGAYGAS